MRERDRDRLTIAGGHMLLSHPCRSTLGKRQLDGRDPLLAQTDNRLEIQSC